VTELVVRPARAGEGAELSALALRSKGHWGYPAEFLEACRAELTYTEADCTSGDLYVAASDDEPAGFHLLRGDELEALFVDPRWIGSGVGGLLLRHALDLARVRGLARVHLDADPGAEPFYVHHGARRIGESPSGSVAGRVLPRLQLGLS
jgi:GNAT superfamily N-acetyltransferase